MVSKFSSSIVLSIIIFPQAEYAAADGSELFSLVFSPLGLTESLLAKVLHPLNKAPAVGTPDVGCCRDECFLKRIPS